MLNNAPDEPVDDDVYVVVPWNESVVAVRAEQRATQHQEGNIVRAEGADQQAHEGEQALAIRRVKTRLRHRCSTPTNVLYQKMNR